MDAKKIFLSEEFQRSFRVHSVAFRPLLESVFVGDYAALISLTAALNKISRKDCTGGMEQLDSLEPFCSNDIDKAALCFFRGIACDMQSETENADLWYKESVEFYDGYYWPFMRLAKSAHKAGRFTEAEEHYLAAIRCFDSVSSNMQFAVMLSSLYCNYASCLMSMGRLNEAETALHCSEKILPNATNREELWNALRILKEK